jgi:hypothetical protein
MQDFLQTSEEYEEMKNSKTSKNAFLIQAFIS